MFSVPSFCISIVWNTINIKKITYVAISFGNIMKEELENQDDIEIASISVVRKLDKTNAYIYRNNFVQFLLGATLYNVEVVKKGYYFEAFYLSPKNDSAAYTVKKLISVCNLASQTIDMFCN